MDFPFPIIDPHIHQWDLLRTPRILSLPRRVLGWNPWLYETVLKLGAKPADRDYVGKVDYVAWDYLPPQYSADAAALPIKQVVHVEAEWRDHSPLGPVGETAWLDRLFDNNLDNSADSQNPGPQLGGIVARADLRSPRLAEVLSAHHNASTKLRGIRQMLASDTDTGIMRFCDRPGLAGDTAWRKGLEQLQPLGLSFDAWVFHHQLNELHRLAKAFPQQQFVLDHMGTPIGLGGPFASYGRNAMAREVILKTWQYGIADLAECPNVAVKLSGLFMPVVGWGFEKRDQPPSAQELLDAFAPICRFVLEHFGVDRCLFASNFPMDKVSLSLESLYALYAATVADLPREDRRKLFHDNAQRIYRLG